MNIRPKIPIFQQGGLPSTVTWSDPTSTWFTRSGIGILEGTYNMLKPLYDKWKSSGSQEDYQAYKKAVDNLNENQRYGYAPGHLKYQSNNNTLFKNSTVGAWQNYVRNNYNFINDSIGKNYKQYHIVSSNPNSGDNPKTGWKTDNLWAGETDDRTTWGNLLNSNDENYLKWKQKFSEIGIDYRTNPEWNTGDALYGFLKSPEELKSLNNPPSDTIQQQQTQKQNGVQVGAKDDTPNDFWSKLQTGFKNIAPDLLDALRLAGNMHNNERVYNESMKAIIPNLQQSYHTYRQVVGDEATKQAYYRRAVQGQTKAGQPFTSDADRQMAYMQEARRIGDELRAQGDLADNQRIRETSAEAAAHADANIERDTTIANQNITELNKAAAAKHQLTAQKYSADWTNIDQYLLGWQARLQQKKARQDAIEDQIKTLQMQDDLANDPDIKVAYDALEAEAKKLYPNGDVNWNDPKLQSLKNNLASVRRKSMIKYYTLYAKSGTKITKKDTTDKYLYRTSRDIVEHFRRMSKMTDDSRIRTMPKAAKMPSHPKKKLQLGGVAPFTVYRPLGVGGETTTQVSQSTDGTSKSTKDTAAKDKLDMIKEMFKAVQSTGLPVDVNVVYRDLNNLFSRAQAFGEELSSDDIATIYLQSMQKISNLKYSKENYDKAMAVATSNESLNEFAVDAAGNYVVQDKEGNLNVAKSLSEIAEKGLNPVTNQQLLNLRAYSPNMAFQRGDSLITNIINNGMGINKIGAQIKALAGSLGSTEGKLEGISQVESGKVKAGLQILAGTAGTPDGYYKITTETKSQKEQVNAALSYIENMLSPAQRAILDSHGGTKPLIQAFLTSQQDATENITMSPLTGKASDKDKEGDLDKLGINSATQLLLGMSSPREFTFSIGNGNMFNGMARVSSITKDGNSVGADFAYSDIYKSDLHKNLDLDNASFGDVLINKALKDRIIIDNSTIAGVDLPYTTDRNGRIIPDFKMLNRIEEADQEILRSGIDPNKDPQKVNEIYAKHNLPIKYGADNRLTGNYKRFAVIQATAIEDVFLDKSGLASNGTLSLVSDEEEINKYINEIKKTTGQKEIDMDRPGLGTGDKDIYKGSIFIPIIGDLVDAVSATGGLKAGNYDELRSKYQTKNYNEAPQFVKQ